MSGIFETVEGWTGPLDFLLAADGIAVDLTGMTLALLLTGSDGVDIDTTGKTSVLSPATAGKVRFSPAASDLLAAKSVYGARWKVTDGASKIVFFPSGVARDQWRVGKP